MNTINAFCYMEKFSGLYKNFENVNKKQYYFHVLFQLKPHNNTEIILNID